MRETLIDCADLSPDECATLQQISQTQQLFADLFNADIFMDCRDKTTGEMYVAAQSSPAMELSLYQHSAVGKVACRQNEPAVYHAMENGMPVRDLKAVTQENRTVRQDALPVRSEESGKVIAVMVSERDVSRDISRDKKYEALVRRSEQETKGFPELTTAGDVTLREIHHRVKNNLQMVASIMNLQCRRTENPEVRRAFRENTARVLSIASIHDILTCTDNAPVSLMLLFDKLRRNLQSVFCESRPVEIVIEGENLSTSPNRATDIALVVNELVSNSLEHGFAEGQKGTIHIQLNEGVQFNTIIVRDNGSGFDAAHYKSESLGLSIVTLTVRDKLGGKLRFSSDETGTTVTFDFLREV